MVKYPHEKLDARHIKDRRFDSLEFNVLIAGELETITSHDITQEECTARIRIAKTLCYHKMYLSDADLRDGYDTVLKKVEQGKLRWTDNLVDELHSHLDYRANVIMRSKMAKQEGFTKVENRLSTAERNDSGAPLKIIYCLDYNLGKCPHHDHHEGQHNSKKVTKFHVCRRCHKEGDFKSHKDTDDVCLRKRS